MDYPEAIPVDVAEQVVDEKSVQREANKSKSRVPKDPVVVCHDDSKFMEVNRTTTIYGTPGLFMSECIHIVFNREDFLCCVVVVSCGCNCNSHNVSSLCVLSVLNLGGRSCSYL